MTPDRRTLLLALTMAGLPVLVEASALNTLARPKPVGKGRLTVLGFKVFDATLYAPDGRYEAEKPPYALELSYLRSLKGADIADRSIQEIRAQGFSDEARLKQWPKQLKSLFPDVKAGDKITGLHQANAKTLFFYNDKPLGQVADTGFAPVFFAIWLGPKTAHPKLRQALLGLKS